MKLSEKGIETIFSALLKTIEERDLVFRRISQGVFKKHIEQLKFEPDDFEMPTTPNGNEINELDAKIAEVPTTPKEVRLTVEEAKEIIGTYIWTNCEIVKQHGIPELKIKNPNWLIHLLERIEQAEKGNEQ